RPVALRPKEFDLLAALVRREGKVATRHELLREVWGYDPEVVSRTVDTHVAELRRKLERDAAHPVHIVTVLKTGYRFTRRPEPGAPPPLCQRNPNSRQTAFAHTSAVLGRRLSANTSSQGLARSSQQPPSSELRATT
ncbi:MAG: winged helix-turn-helix domain-containing protein, partial [Gemmatimonadaceae bacterium]